MNASVQAPLQKAISLVLGSEEATLPDVTAEGLVCKGAASGRGSLSRHWPDTRLMQDLFRRPEQFTYQSMQHLAVNFRMGIRPGNEGIGVVAERPAWIGYTPRFGV